MGLGAAWDCERCPCQRGGTWTSKPFCDSVIPNLSTSLEAAGLHPLFLFYFQATFSLPIPTCQDLGIRARSKWHIFPKVNIDSNNPMDLRGAPGLNWEQEWEIPAPGAAHPVLLNELMGQEWEIPSPGAGNDLWTVCRSFCWANSTLVPLLWDKIKQNITASCIYCLNWWHFTMIFRPQGF